MRINQFLAQGTDLSRRKADEAIEQGRVEINGTLAKIGDIVIESDYVTLDGQIVPHAIKLVTIMLNKPAGYVVSKNGQGSQTIYDLLPEEFHSLNPIGRLDKNSSGLLLLTNDGELANKLTHPSHEKKKIYEVELNKSLDALDQDLIHDKGVKLEDGISRLELKPLNVSGKSWRVTMHEGRNRQIRRTFAALGYKVVSLHRTHFGDYTLGKLPEGEIKTV